MMRTPKTLYVVADGGRARYIERVGPARFGTFRNFVSAHIHEKPSDLVNDRLARVQESATAARHAIAARSDPRGKIETAFVRSIARDLTEQAVLDGFDNLVFIAPAKLHRIFRDSLTSALTEKLVKCIAKNLTKIPDGDLHSHLPVFLMSKPAA